MKTKLMGLGAAAIVAGSVAGTASAGSALGLIQSMANQANAGGKSVVFQDNLYVFDPTFVTSAGTDGVLVNGGAFAAVFEFETIAVSSNLTPPLNNSNTAGFPSATLAVEGVTLRGVARGTLDSATGAVTGVAVTLYGLDSADGALAGESYFATSNPGSLEAQLLLDGYTQLATFGLDGDDFWNVGVSGNVVNFTLGLSVTSAAPGFPDARDLPTGLGGSSQLYGAGSQGLPSSLGGYVAFQTGVFNMALVPTPAALAPGLAMLGALGVFRARRRIA